MIEYSSECVGCPDGVPCMGDSCPMNNVPHFICDECGREDCELYQYDDEQLCKDCLAEKFEKVEV